MRAKRWILTILLVGLACVIGGALLIQLVPYGKDYTNPPVLQEPAWDSPQTRDLAKRACFDCHSNETVWPWYSRVAPVSWLTARDVYKGREKLNFSEWNREYRDVDEVPEVIQEGEMPPWFYLPMHPEAKLSGDEQQALLDGLRKTLGLSGKEN